MKKTRVLIADDHRVVRSGLRGYIESDPTMVVTGEASDGNEALDLLERHAPDVAVIDISMPIKDGVETTKEIRRMFPSIRVLVLTIHDDEEFVTQLIKAGADGYVLKDADKREILEAIRTVASGARFFSPRIAKLMEEEFVRRLDGTRASGFNPSQKLTRREIEVLRHVALGLTNQEIASALFISPLTVHTHRNNLMQKLGIHDAAGLARYAIQIGLITAAV
jgi:two-component system nitrate/nitrite response regulator NarL